MKQTRTLLVYMVTGTILGTVFSLLIVWPSTPHMQYLKSEEVYQFSFIGMIGGIIGGLLISVLSPKRNWKVLLPTIILGAICGVFTMWLTMPYNLKTNWVYALSTIGLLTGAISGLFISKLNLPHKLDVAIQEKLIGGNDIETNNLFLIRFSGAILGGTIGAILTVVAVIFYIISTPDSNPFTHTFGRIQHYYFFIPIGSLLGVGYLFAKTPAVKTVYSMVSSFSEGIIFGLMTGLMLEILLLLFVLSGWISSRSDNLPGPESTIVMIFPILVGFGSAMFGISVSLTSNALIAILNWR